MSALLFLLLAVVLSAAGSAVLVLRQRKPSSVTSSIEAFRREMQALAPSPEHDDRPQSRK